MMEYNTSLIRGPIGKSLVRFAIPLLLANLLQMFYSMVDMYIVGRFAETADVSAVSTASMLTMVLTVTVAGFATGSSVLVGQFAGAGKPDDISKTVGTSITLFGIISVAVLIPLILLCRPIVALLNAPAGAEQKTYEYLLICLVGMFFVFGYNLITGILRGMGNSKAPLIFVAVSSVVNIITDYILVKIFGLGAAGAAYATAGSQLVSLIFSLFYCRFHGAGFHLNKKDIRLSRTYTGKIAKIGGPIALQEFLVNLSFVFITAVINGFSLYASAASGIVEKILAFICMPTSAFSAAVASFAAGNIGAAQPKRARRAMWIGIFICLVFTLLVFIITFFRGEWLVGIFTKDPDVIENGRLYLKTYGFDPVMLSFVFIMNGYFNACGHSVFTMAHSLITTFCLRVPMVWLFSRMAGATLLHIGIAAPVSSLVSILLCIIFLLRMRQKEALSDQ